MGAFFTNMQVSCENKDKDELKKNLIEYIKNILKQEGYDFSDEKEESDRTIVLIQHEDNNWIGIYDEAFEEQDLKYLNSSSSLISKEFDTKVIDIIVHDSDVLNLSYFNNGKMIDGYCNNVNYFSGKKKKKRGNPELWKDLLKNEVQIESIIKIWNKEEIFAEDVLSNMLDLIGIENKYGTVGFYYLQDQSFDEKIELNFKLKDNLKKDDKESGPPVFDTAGCPIGTKQVFLGDDFEIPGFSVKNKGGESKGLVVYIYGPAVEKELVEINEVLLRKVKDLSQKDIDKRFIEYRSTLKKETDKNGMLIFVALFSEIQIEAGFKKDFLENSAPGQKNKKFIKQLGQNISLIPKFRAKNIGKDNIYIGVAPNDNSKNGFIGFSLPVEILKSGWKPINYISDNFNQKNLVMLNQKEVVFSLVIFDSINEQNKDNIINIIKSFHDLFQHKKDQKYKITYNAEGSIYPKIKNLAVEKLLKSTFWRSIDQHIKSNCNISFVIDDIKDFDNGIFKTSGIKLFDNITFIPENKKLAVILVFWDYLDQDRELDSIQKNLLQVMNEFIEKNDIIQGFLGVWGDSPMFGYGTIYENVCGVDGSYAIVDEWCMNHLRCITENIWLCEGLFKKIDVENIKNIAEIIDIGNSKRIKLNKKSNMIKLEELLISILPDKEEYIDFSKNLFKKS